MMNRRQLAALLVVAPFTFSTRNRVARHPPYLILRAGHYDHVEVTGADLEEMASRWITECRCVPVLARDRTVGVVSQLAALWDQDDRRALYAGVDWRRSKINEPTTGPRQKRTEAEAYLSVAFERGNGTRLLHLRVVGSVQHPRGGRRIPFHHIPVHLVSAAT